MKKLFDTFYLYNRGALCPIDDSSCITSDPNELSVEMWDEIQQSFLSASRTTESAIPHISALLFKEELSRKHESRIREFAEQQRSMVRIDVGGQVFCAAKDTLLRCEGSYFTALLNSGQFLPDQDGIVAVSSIFSLLSVILQVRTLSEEVQRTSPSC